MSDDFKLSDLNHPLYEYSQVITWVDLQNIYRGLATQHDDMEWHRFIHKRDLVVAGKVIYELLMWLQDGKPSLRKLGDNNESSK